MNRTTPASFFRLWRRLLLCVCFSVCAASFTPAAHGEELADAPASPTTAPTMVSIDLHQVPVEDVISEWARQASPRARVDRRSDAVDPADVPLVNFKAQGPAMLVLKQMCEALRLQPGTDAEGTLHFVRSDPDAPPRAGRAPDPFWPASACWSMAGPILVVATSATADDIAVFPSGHPGPRSTTVQLLALLDPNVKLIAGSSSLEIDQAVDDRGHSLVPPGLTTYGLLPVGSFKSFTWKPTARVLLPADRFSRIVLLKGRLHVLVLTRSEKLEFTDLAAEKPSDKTVGGLRFGHSALQTSEHSKAIDITLFRDDHTPAEFAAFSHLLPPSPYTLPHIYDADGKYWPGQLSIDRTERVNARFRMAVLTTPDEPLRMPTRLTWEIPTGAKEYELPVELHDIPLP